MAVWAVTVVVSGPLLFADGTSICETSADIFQHPCVGCDQLVVIVRCRKDENMAISEDAVICFAHNR